MDVVKESGSESVKKKDKKKQKKRNYDEWNVVVGGEVGSVGLDDGGRSKRLKIEGLSDVGCDLNGDNMSKKDKKKKKGKSRGSIEERKSEKWKGKEKESKGSDDGKVLDNVDGCDGEGTLGRGVSELNSGMQGKVCVGEGEIEHGENNVNDVKESEKSAVGVAVDIELVSARKEHVSGHKDLKKVKKKKAEAHANEDSERVEPVEKKRKKSVVGGVIDTELIIAGEEHVSEQGEGKKVIENKRKTDTKSVVGGEKDTKLVTEGEEHLSEEGGVKKVKKNKSKMDLKSNEAGSNDIADSVGFVEIQNVDDVAGKSQPPVEKLKKTTKKKNKNKKEKVIEAVDLTEGSCLKTRKVKFTDNVEVFPLGEEEFVGGSNSSEGEEDLANGGYSSEGEEYLEDGSNSSKRKKKLEDGTDSVVQGKRFSKEEDEIVRAAVLKYVEDNHLGEEGIEMVMKCRQHGKKLRNCWKEIAEAIPWRTKDAVYSRAHILFERGESRKWTKEELEMIRDFHQKHGPKWRELADELRKHRVHVKDAFRQVKLPNKKIGQWSQEEYQSLFDLVNKDLCIKVSMEKKSKHGMLRDNIGWESISRMLSTRTDPVCCQNGITN